MRRHKADFLIMILTMALIGVGLIVIYTIGPVRANFLNAAYGADYSENYFFIHQLISVALAVAAFFALYKFPYEKTRKFVKVIMAGALGACLVLALAQWMNLPIARCELGACRWFNFAGISLQPAEFLKFGIALYLAQLTAEYKRGEGFKKDFWIRYLVAVGLSLFFVIIVQKDLGSGLPIALEALAILLVAGVPMKTFILIVAVALVAGFGVIMTSEHRRERVMTYFGFGNSSSEVLEESESESSDSYHIENALIAIGSGGLFGVGIGNSVQATGYLPESINDSVFAIMGETFGFVGLLAILAVFTVLLLRVLRVSDYSRDQEMSLVAVGAFAWLMTHVAVNIMAMTNLVPLTGITLPLLSYGGTSMMCVAGMLGLVMQFSAYTERKVILDAERGSVQQNPVARFSSYASRGSARYNQPSQINQPNRRRRG